MTDSELKVGSAATVVVELLGAMGLDAVQVLTALDMAARIGRLEMSAEQVQEAHDASTRFLADAGLVS